jgi:GMP synthase (glutamine-hydrolysing)
MEIKGQLRKIIGNKRAVAAVSGGVDSTTAATLAYKSLGENVIPIMIDTGFLRENETFKVKELLKGVLPLRIIDKSENFIRRLEGKYDAEDKRKTFREIFYSVLREIMEQYGAEYLIQGTIAADWVETKWGIKTQHNVLTQIGIDTERRWGFKVVEPLADLYKNEVRELARILGIPKEIVNRQPFPGPGLLVRVVGRVTREKLEIVRKATSIVEEELSPFNPSQYFAAIFEAYKENKEDLSTELGVNVRTYTVKATGVMGDVRAYGDVGVIDFKDYLTSRKISQRLAAFGITHTVVSIDNNDQGYYTIAIRAVKTEDFMTADIVEIPIDYLKKVAKRLLNLEQVKEVVYDVSTKPPATIEFE